MKCYYEVLGLPRDTSDEDIKKAYRKLALQWHPDKNLDNIDEAKSQFQLVQQAYEVLGDSNERAWYDKHRESIIRGGANGNYEDSSLDVFQYFTSSCYSGFGDDEKGFYSVYGEVFNKIAAEDSEFYSDGESDFEIPHFGKSVSSFEEVVNPFYSYWQSYSTRKSYSWLNVHDIREASNRKIVRLMEKDNKKVRDKAKKDRNEEVRALVNFVKKRDKRVQAHSEYLKEKKDINVKKAEEQRQIKLKERREEMAGYQESDWAKFSNLEKELKVIEDNLAKEFGDESESDSYSDDDDDDSKTFESKQDALYCVACNKLFKNPKAFQNHENSKKHKENTSVLKLSVLDSEDLIGTGQDEDVILNNEEIKSNTSLDNNYPNPEVGSPNELSDTNSSSNEIDELPCIKEGKKSKRKKKIKNKDILVMNSSLPDEASGLNENNSDEDVCFDDLLCSSKKQRKKNRQKQLLVELTNIVEPEENNTIPSEDESSLNLLKKNKKKGRSSKKPSAKTSQTQEKCPSENSGARTTLADAQQVQEKTHDKSEKSSSNVCVSCKSNFSSKNKLFEHLKSTGHATYLGSTINNVTGTNNSKETCKSKKKRKV